MGKLTHTVGGNSNLVSFRSAARVPITSLKVHFSPVQEGEGTPSPENVRPISGWTRLEAYKAGKNLLNEAFLFDYANYPIVGKYGYKYTEPIFLNPNTTYRFSFTTPQTYETARYWAIKVYDDTYADINDTGTVHYLVNNKVTSGQSITTGAQGVIRFAVYGGQATLDDIWNNTTIQLEIGSTVTSYEPYQGTALPITFPVLGKNKLNNNSNFWEVGSMGASGGKDNRTTRIRTIDFINALPNTTYTISISNGYSFAWNEFYSGIHKYYYDWQSGSYTFTTHSDVNQLFFIIKKDNTTDITPSILENDCHIQLELGSTATTYEPYDPNNTVYGGYVDLATGEMVEQYVSRNINEINISLSSSTSEPWVHRFTIRGKWISNNVGYENAGGAFDWYCNIFEKGNATTNGTGLSASGVLYLYDNTINSVDEFKEKYKDIQVVFRVREAAETHTTLTPTQLTTLLNHNNIWSNTNGPTEVSYAIHDSAMIRAAKRRIVGFNSMMVEVPMAYQKVEWIEASNATPYIDTGIYLTGELQAEIHYYNDKQEAFLFGSRKSTSGPYCNFNIDSDGRKCRFDYSTRNMSGLAGFRDGSHDGEYLFTFKNRVGILTGLSLDLNVTRNEYTQDNTLSLYADYPVLLFGVRTGTNLSLGSTSGSLRIYSAKFWLGGTYTSGAITGAELVRDFVPCVRKSDNVAGMYDKVTKQFFTSANSDTFTIPT